MICRVLSKSLTKVGGYCITAVDSPTAATSAWTFLVVGRVLFISWLSKLSIFWTKETPSTPNTHILSLSLSHTHTHQVYTHTDTHTRTHTQARARTHARTHAHTHTHTDSKLSLTVFLERHLLATIVNCESEMSVNK